MGKNITDAQLKDLISSAHGDSADRTTVHEKGG